MRHLESELNLELQTTTSILKQLLIFMSFCVVCGCPLIVERSECRAPARYFDCVVCVLLVYYAMRRVLGSKLLLVPFPRCL